MAIISHVSGISLSRPLAVPRLNSQVMRVIHGHAFSCTRSSVPRFRYECTFSDPTLSTVLFTLFRNERSRPFHPIKLVGSAEDSVANAGRFFGVDSDAYSTPVSRLGKCDEYDHTACAWRKRRTGICKEVGKHHIVYGCRLAL